MHSRLLTGQIRNAFLASKFRNDWDLKGQDAMKPLKMCNTPQKFSFNNRSVNRKKFQIILREVTNLFLLKDTRTTIRRPCSALSTRAQILHGKRWSYDSVTAKNFDWCFFSSRLQGTHSSFIDTEKRHEAISNIWNAIIHILPGHNRKHFEIQIQHKEMNEILKGKDAGKPWKCGRSKP